MTAEVCVSLLQGGMFIPANRLSDSVNALIAPDSGFMVAITRRHPTREARSGPLEPDPAPRSAHAFLRMIQLLYAHISGIKHSYMTFQAVPRT